MFSFLLGFIERCVILGGGDLDVVRSADKISMYYYLGRMLDWASLLSQLFHKV